MKMQMNAWRGGAVVRAGVLCLLAVFCLSLVALPAKAGPPLPPYAPVIQDESKADPWGDIFRRKPTRDECKEGTGQMRTSAFAPVTDWVVRIVISLTGDSRERNSTEPSVVDNGRRR